VNFVKKNYFSLSGSAILFLQCLSNSLSKGTHNPLYTYVWLGLLALYCGVLSIREFRDQKYRAGIGYLVRAVGVIIISIGLGPLLAYYRWNWWPMGIGFIVVCYGLSLDPQFHRELKNAGEFSSEKPAIPVNETSGIK
jgi:hypothetical protein